MSESGQNQEQKQLLKNAMENNKNDDNLEDLLRTLHNQIHTSDWLQANTANKLEHENPDLIKAWKEAINEKPN
jgi:hypothetical protein